MGGRSININAREHTHFRTTPARHQRNADQATRTPWSMSWSTTLNASFRCKLAVSSDKKCAIWNKADHHSETDKTDSNLRKGKEACSLSEDHPESRKRRRRLGNHARKRASDSRRDSMPIGILSTKPKGLADRLSVVLDFLRSDGEPPHDMYNPARSMS